MAEKRRESRRRFGEKRREEKEKEKEKRREKPESGKPGKPGKPEMDKPEKLEKEEEGKEQSGMEGEIGETKGENGETGEPKVETSESKEETSEKTSNPPSPTEETGETGETGEPLKDPNDLSSFSESQKSFILRFREAVSRGNVESVRVLLRQCKQQRLCFGKKRKQYVLAIRSTVTEAEELLKRSAEHERLRKEHIESIEESENWKPYLSALGSDRFGHVFFLFPHDFNNLYFLGPDMQHPADRFVETLFQEGPNRDTKTREGRRHC